jgi:hypothetical protein
MGFATLDMGHKTDPTGVMFVGGIVKALSWDHGAEQ